MEILSLLSMICDARLLMCIPFLWEVGFIIKHYTRLYNGYIPMVEAVLGAIIGVIYGAFVGKNGVLPVDIITYGAQGLVVGCASCFTYDAFHGIVNHKCEILKEEDMEKKKFHPLEHAWFVYGLAIVESVIACGLVELVFHGKAEMVKWFAYYAHLTIIPCVAIDIMTKVSRERPLVTWQYFVLEALIVVADLLFTWASITTTNIPMFILLASTAIVIGGAVIWYLKFYKPAYAKKCAEVAEAIKSELESNGMPAQYVGIAIDYFYEKGE